MLFCFQLGPLNWQRVRLVPQRSWVQIPARERIIKISQRLSKRRAGRNVTLQHISSFQMYTVIIYFVQQVFFLLSTEGSLVNIRAYQPYTLVGPPVRGLVYNLLAVYSSRTDYIYILCLVGLDDVSRFQNILSMLLTTSHVK